MEILRRHLAYWADFRMFKQHHDGRFSIDWADRYPCLGEHSERTVFDTHYVYHTAWAARILAELQPSCHVDISSSLYFAAIVSAFIPVRFYDYRPADLNLSNFETARADLLKLPFADQSLPSLSCMHVIEHVGLGRYGDPLDPQGDKKAAAELSRVLAPGGTLLFACPIGRPRIQFNAHRIYAWQQALDLFPELRLESAALIPDDALDQGIIQPADECHARGQSYACGCFWLKKED